MTDIDTSSNMARTYSTWRYHTDPDFRSNTIKRSVEYRRNRRQQDPDYDAKLREQWCANARKNAEKLAQDPERVAQRKEYLKQYHLKRKAEKHALQQAAQPVPAL